MKGFLHSVSRSYTRQTGETGRLGRGLVRDRSGQPIQPQDLAAFLAEDPDLVLRQTVSVLDKVVQKRGTLRGMSAVAYRHRAQLAGRLWRELADRLQEASPSALDPEALQRLHARWIEKAHPYRVAAVDARSPENDENYRRLFAQEQTKPARPFTDYQGKWFAHFWVAGEEAPRYGEIAKAMAQHLFDQEHLIKGGDRKQRKGAPPAPTGSGQMRARGAAASTSAQDPRSKTKRQKHTWNLKDADFYFQKGDVAAAMHAKLKTLEEINEPINASWFAAQIHAHFGELKELSAAEEGDRRKGVWNFHNAVRGYYKKLAGSTRFRLALRKARPDQSGEMDEAEKAKLLQMVPASKSILIARLAHRDLPAGTELPDHPGSYIDKALLSKANAEISRDIRLGKLVVHAADALADADRPEFSDFKTAMDYFATSEGQSEIKRLETSARIWRKATALSLRSLKALVDPGHRLHKVVGPDEHDEKKPGRPLDLDLTSFMVAKTAFEGLQSGRHSEDVASQLAVIFGNKEIGPAGQKRSRRSIFTDAQFDEISYRNECIWALMRITAQLRHSVFHFNVRRRLLHRVQKAFLTVAHKGWNAKHPDSKRMTPRADAALKTLLEFDQSIEGVALADELTQMKATQFVDEDKLRALATEFVKYPEPVDYTLPKVRSVLLRAQNLAKAVGSAEVPLLAPLTYVEIGNEPQANTLANLCKVGLLRMLYRSGFRTWLAGAADDQALFKDVMEKVIRSRNERVDALGRARGKTLPSVSELIEELDVAEFKGLQEILNALTSETIQASGQHRKYTPDRRVQRDQAQDIEHFKQEIIAHLFAKYLRDSGFSCIGSLETAAVPEAYDPEVILDEIQTSPLVGNADWHRQFYAWLYLVPPEETSLLRHQIRKSLALEAVADKDTVTTDEEMTSGPHRIVSPTITMLREMDSLIELYTRVQSAGFQGDEHKAALRNGAQFYEDSEKFDDVYDEDPDLHKYSLKGTRRGLRQLVRFAHLPVLSPVFQEHLITDSEVNAFTEHCKDGNKALFDTFHNLRRDIIKAETSKTPKEDKKLIADKTRNISLYKSTAVDVLEHTFNVNAARLSDHVRLHRMLMQIVGRLADYVLMWERDRIYVLVGCLFQNDTQGQFELEVTDKDEIVLKVLTAGAEISHRFTLYDEKIGFAALDVKEILGKLGRGAKADLLKRYFCEIEQQNPLDREIAEKARKERRSRRDFPPGGDERRKSKAQVRNDIVHQNLLDHIKSPKSGVNLTYAMNAVRSLMAYDRKLKNAVPQSIKRILGDYGLEIDWTMGAQDQLKKPDVTPARETHLGFCRPSRDPDNPPALFDLPRASPRFVSMAQALFDLGTSGHAEKIIERGEKAGRVIAYPARSLSGYRGDPNPLLPRLKREFRYRKSARL